MNFTKFFSFLIIILLSGCAGNVAVVTFQSEPSGARIYSSDGSFLGTTPFRLEYPIPDSYSETHKDWDWGYVTAYLSGYTPKKKRVDIELSNYHSVQGPINIAVGDKTRYLYNILILFDKEVQSHNFSKDEFYISSFQDTKAGSYPKKRDSFSKTETPELVIIGYKSKLANIKVYSISSNKLVYENNSYIPEQSNTYMHIPLQNLKPDSYKVDCSIEGIVVKTLFFTVFN